MSDGAVADGVEAQLEAGGGAFGGHGVELRLVIAGQAGVRGVVGVGGEHGGGAGAERAVHEALEHAGVEHAIVGRLGGAHALELIQGCVEGQPLGHANRQLALALQLLEHEEVFPIGVVLDRGEAMRGGVGKCEFHAAAAVSICRRGDAGLDLAQRGVFADDASGGARGVAVEVAALRMGGGIGDAGCS